MSHTSPPERAAVEYLKGLQPGVLPFDVFHQIARLSVMSIIELVPLRKVDDKLEILLLPRPADDPVWPNQLHVPGTVLRASDQPGTFDDAFKRILGGELAGTETEEPAFVQNIFHHSGRGMECSQVYNVEVSSTPSAGTFYDTEQLPATIVKSQMDFIPAAIAAFKARI